MITLRLESMIGDSKNDVGLNIGGILIDGDLEIGSLAGDISLYLALELLLLLFNPMVVAHGSSVDLRRSELSKVEMINPVDDEVAGDSTVVIECEVPSISAFDGEGKK